MVTKRQFVLYVNELSCHLESIDMKSNININPQRPLVRRGRWGLTNQKIKISIDLLEMEHRSEKLNGKDEKTPKWNE